MKIAKHIISLLFVFTCVTMAIADNYIPLVKEGAVWVYDRRGVDFQYPYVPTMKLWFEGDTIINGEQYKCLYNEFVLYVFHGSDWDNPERRVNTGYYGAWQERDKKVYVWDVYGQKKVLYYDFNLKKDDVVPDLPFDPEVAWKKITDEDTIEVNGIKRRRLELTYDYYELGVHRITQSYWVEGIGSFKDLLTPTGCMTWGGFSGFEYFEGDSCLFTLNEFLLPKNGNGTATEVRTSSIKDCPLKTSPIFDLQGRRLSEKPKRGMYIKDGKKYVVK